MATANRSGIDCDDRNSYFSEWYIKRWRKEADGDYIITRWTDVATHTGSYMGIAPTHRTIRFSGIAIDRIVDVKIVPM